MKNVCLNLPDQLLLLGGSPEKIAEEMFKLYVLDFVRRKVISADYGAELLNVHLTDFVNLMREYGIPYFTELPHDPDKIEKLLQQASGD